jgi:tetratricopeptide (TPR) repeat protein
MHGHLGAPLRPSILGAPGEIVGVPAGEAPKDQYDRFRRAIDDAEAAGDAAGAVRAALSWVQAYPENAGPAHRLSDLYRRQGDLKAALAVLQQALERLPNDTSLLKAASSLCGLMNDFDSATEYLLLCAEAPEERRECLVKAAGFQIRLADAAGAKRSLEDAFAAGEPPERHRLALAQIAYLQRDRARGLALLDAEDAEHGVSPASQNTRQKLQLLPAERKAAPSIRLRSPATDELKAYAVASGVPTGEANAAATRLITEAGDILIERVPDSPALLLAFGGLSTMFGGTAEEMSFLVRTVRLNALFVSDPQRLFMLGGFASIGEYWTTIGWLKDLKQAWSIEHIYCLGLSGGGYPALRYGLDLGARRILTFAAPTEITPTITQVDKRATALTHRVLARRPHMCVNLRDEIAKLGDAAPEIINYYGADMPEDAYHARNIEGLPTVSSRPVEGLASHGVIAWLKQNGAFIPILHEFLREVSPLRAEWSRS